MQIRTILYLCFRIAMVLMFLLGVIGWQIADFWKAAHVLKNFHMLVPKRACMDLNLCCTCVRCWFTTRTVQQITSRQADSQDLAFARLICLTITQRSEFSWLWHPQNTKKKDFLDFAGIRIEIQSCSETHLKDFDLDSKSIGPKDSKIHNHPPTKIRGRSVESSATAMG